MTILPGETACLRCLMPECPRARQHAHLRVGRHSRPDRGVIASIEAVEAIKILSGNRCSISRSLTVVDFWQDAMPPMFRQVDVSGLREQRGLPGVQARRVRVAFRPLRQPHGRALRPQRRAIEPSRHEHLARRTGPEARGRRPSRPATSFSCG